MPFINILFYFIFLFFCKEFISFNSERIIVFCFFLFFLFFYYFISSFLDNIWNNRKEMIKSEFKSFYLELLEYLELNINISSLYSKLYLFFLNFFSFYFSFLFLRSFYFFNFNSFFLNFHLISNFNFFNFSESFYLLINSYILKLLGLSILNKGKKLKFSRFRLS